MFTGIITDVGQIRRVAQAGDLRVEIETAYDAAGIDLAVEKSLPAPEQKSYSQGQLVMRRRH